MRLLVKIGIWGLNLLYFFHKLFPVKNQIAFISRQSDTISLDYRLLKAELQKKYPDIQVVELFRMIPPAFGGKIKYAFHLIGPQLHAFAVSRVVIVDGYSIAASVLKHKKRLKIIQMWHAMGSLKRFGYASVGKEEGSSEKTADMFKMHKNYDYIFSSSSSCIPALSLAFKNRREKFMIMSLPRTDLLTDKEYMEKLKEKIIEKYPQIKNKKNILYAPTFRKVGDMEQAIEDFIQRVDYERFNLIVKLHPLVKEKTAFGKAFSCDEFTALELLAIADCVVTDYSAFIFEAAVAGKPIMLYAFDLEDYKKNRGFLMDIEKEAPGPVCRNVSELLACIETEKYNVEAVKRFADKYVEQQTGCTERFAKFVNTLYNDNDY